MQTPPDLSGTIQTATGNPLQASQDGLSAQQQPIPDLITADRYLAAKQANQVPPFGVRFGAIISPGMQGRSRCCPGQGGCP